MTNVNQNYITERIKKLEKELGEKITDPAGSKNNLIFTFADAKKAKENKLEAKGSSYSNKELLRKQGFKENADGTLVIKAESHVVDKDSKGNIIRLEDRKKESKEAVETGRGA